MNFALIGRPHQRNDFISRVLEYDRYRRIIGCTDVVSAQRSVETMIACMRHSDDAIVKVLPSPDANACIASCCLAGSFSARVSGVSSDGRMLAFSGELFPGEPPLTVESQGNVWNSFRDRGLSAIEEFNGLFSGALIDPGRSKWCCSTIDMARSACTFVGKK